MNTGYIQIKIPYWFHFLNNCIFVLLIESFDLTQPSYTMHDVHSTQCLIVNSPFLFNNGNFDANHD